MINPQPIQPMPSQPTDQDVKDVETAIAELGPLSPDNFDQASQLLQQRKEMLDSIEVADTTQFYPDANSLIAVLRRAADVKADRLVPVSQFLRTFAEYIAGNAMGLDIADPKIKSVVDGIKSMTGGN